MKNQLLFLFVILLLPDHFALADLVEDASEDTSAASQKPNNPASSGGGLIQEDGAPGKSVKQQKPSSKTTTEGPKSQASEPKKSEPKEKSEKAERNRNPDAPIEFSSNTFSGEREGGILILEDNVVVTQDDLRISADKATLKIDRQTNDVTEVIAVGRVHFFRKDPETGQPVSADSREAVFNNATRTVILKGDPKMVRGNDVVRGKQIIYDLTSGWVKATRVEGVVQPTKADAKKAGPSKSSDVKSGDVKASDSKVEVKGDVEKSAGEK